jgi:hypothetical protein
MYKSKDVYYSDGGPYITLRGLAHYTTGVIHGLNQAREEDCDLMICMERGNARWEMLEYLNNNPRPKGWKKVGYQVHGDINKHLDRIPLFATPNIDYLMITHPGNQDENKIFGKPFLFYRTPYDFEKHNKLIKTPKKNKIALQAAANEKRSRHLLRMLYVIKNVPEAEATIQVRTGGKELREYAKCLGLNLTVTEGWKNRVDYLNSIADCKVVLSMESYPTMGHTQLDAACVGAWSVGWHRSPFQKLAYPDLGISPYNLDDAIVKVKDALAREPYVVSDQVKEFHNPGNVIKFMEGQL